MFAVNEKKDDLRKDIQALRRIMAIQVKKSEPLYTDIALEISRALNRLYKQSLESIETIKNLNRTSTSIWITRASFANVSIFECLFDLQDLWVAQRDTQDEIRVLINDEWTEQVRINRELSESINETILEETITLNDKLDACEDDDDICVDLVEIRVISDWEKLPSEVATGLRTAANWFTNKLAVENVRDLVRRFKADAEAIVEKTITCIKQKLE